MAKEQSNLPANVQPPSALDRFKNALAKEAELNENFADDDGESIADQIMEQMLLADTFEEALAIQDKGLPSAQNMVDFEHEVTGFEVVQSTKGDGALKQYLRVQATALMDWPPFGLNAGSEFVYAVGATNPVTLLYKARACKKLPLQIFYREKSTGKDDNALLILRLVPKRVTTTK